MKRTSQARYLGIAATVLIAAGVLVTRGGNDTSVSSSHLQDRAEPAPSAPPRRVPPTAVAVPAPTPSPAAAAAHVRVPPHAEATVDPEWIPTELPDSPELERMLNPDGQGGDWRERTTYRLGLMASYEKCMSGRNVHGTIYYSLSWQVDADHLASSPTFRFSDIPSDGEVSKDDEQAFEACVNEYLAEHDTVYLPRAEPPGVEWGTGAVFPLRDSPLLQAIIAAQAEISREGPRAANSSPR